MARNLKLSDDVIAHVLQLQRVAAGTEIDILNLYRAMSKRLVAELKVDNLTVFKKTRLTRLFDDVNQIIEATYDDAEVATKTVLEDLVKTEVNFTEKAIQRAFPIEIAIATPTAGFIREVATSTLIEGLPSSEWWEKQEKDVKLRFQQVVREGLAIGDTPTQMARKLRETLKVSEANVQSLVQTSVSAVSNNVRTEVFEKNDDVIKELKWLSTLDNRVCSLCIVRADKRWKNDDAHTPIGHSIPFRRPPIHFNDRCVIVPVTKTFKELGIDLPEPSTGQRASSEGPQPGTTTFASFLNRQTKEFQDDTLGPGRAELWRGNKITLSQLTNGKGRELTLTELDLL